MDQVTEKSIQAQYNDTTSQILNSLPRISIKWTHIELGAANYAENPHGDPSHKSSQDTCSKSQYTLLFSTIDKLIQKKGKRGVFYINDLKKQDVDYTITQLDQYIKQQYANAEIEVKPLPGDFFKIDLPRVDSIHLKNPDYWFFISMDMEENRQRLAFFADYAKEGLTLITYFKRPFLHRLENLGVGYKIRNHNYSPYIHADGTAITRHGNTIEFIIKSLATLKEEQQTGYTTRYSFRPLILNRGDDISGPNVENVRSTQSRGEKYIDPYFVPPEEVDTLLKI